MKNPIMTASGTFGSGREYVPFVNLNKLGALVVKSVTLNERSGNSCPRICETPSGILNSIGLQNSGIERFIAEEIPFLSSFDMPLIVNVAGESVEEYARVCALLEDVRGVSGIELNISCPNVKKGGMLFGQDPKMATEIVVECKKTTKIPLIVKLTPNIADNSIIAREVENAGADAVSLINTLMGMAIDIETFKPMLGNITGGLSGPAIRPVAVRMVWEVAKAVSIPVIGMGGISSARDAIEFFLVGAQAVAIGTANFIDPAATMNIVDELDSFLNEKGFKSIKEIIGQVKA